MMNNNYSTADTFTAPGENPFADYALPQWIACVEQQAPSAPLIQPLPPLLDGVAAGAEGGAVDGATEISDAFSPDDPAPPGDPLIGDAPAEGGLDDGMADPVSFEGRPAITTKAMGEETSDVLLGCWLPPLQPWPPTAESPDNSSDPLTGGIDPWFPEWTNTSGAGELEGESKGGSSVGSEEPSWLDDSQPDGEGLDPLNPDPHGEGAGDDTRTGTIEDGAVSEEVYYFGGPPAGSVDVSLGLQEPTADSSLVDDQPAEVEIQDPISSGAEDTSWQNYQTYSLVMTCVNSDVQFSAVEFISDDSAQTSSESSSLIADPSFGSDPAMADSDPAVGDAPIDGCEPVFPDSIAIDPGQPPSDPADPLAGESGDGAPVFEDPDPIFEDFLCITMALGEEGGSDYWPPAEEVYITMALGEEGGSDYWPPAEEVYTTMALGEEGGSEYWPPAEGDGFASDPEDPFGGFTPIEPIGFDPFGDPFQDQSTDLTDGSSGDGGTEVESGDKPPLATDEWIDSGDWIEPLDRMVPISCTTMAIGEEGGSEYWPPAEGDGFASDPEDPFGGFTPIEPIGFDPAGDPFQDQPTDLTDGSSGDGGTEVESGGKPPLATDEWIDSGDWIEPLDWMFPISWEENGETVYQDDVFLGDGQMLPEDWSTSYDDQTEFIDGFEESFTSYSPELCVLPPVFAEPLDTQYAVPETTHTDVDGWSSSEDDYSPVFVVEMKPPFIQDESEASSDLSYENDSSAEDSSDGSTLTDSNYDDVVTVSLPPQPDPAEWGIVNFSEYVKRIYKISWLRCGTTIEDASLFEPLVKGGVVLDDLISDTLNPEPPSEQSWPVEKEISFEDNNDSGEAVVFLYGAGESSGESEEPQVYATDFSENPFVSAPATEQEVSFAEPLAVRPREILPWYRTNSLSVAAAVPAEEDPVNSVGETNSLAGSAVPDSTPLAANEPVVSGVSQNIGVQDNPAPSTTPVVAVSSAAGLAADSTPFGSETLPESSTEAVQSADAPAVLGGGFQPATESPSPVSLSNSWVIPVSVPTQAQAPSSAAETPAPTVVADTTEAVDGKGSATTNPAEAAAASELAHAVVRLLLEANGRASDPLEASQWPLLTPSP